MRFEAPTTLDDAVALLAGSAGHAHVLAGGTDLVVQMTAGLRAPDMIVDIKRIPDLGCITEDEQGFCIGAAVCGAQINENSGLKASWPGVCEAVDLIGSMQVQSRATPVGNLCNCSPAADSVPALIAAGCVAEIVSAEGTRHVPVEDIPTGPGRTCLKTGELISALRLPHPAPQSGDAYMRFTPRTEMDIAIVGVGVSLTLDETGLCTAARVAVGAVAPTARLVPEAAAALIGTQIDADALRQAADAVRAACDPIDDKRGSAAYRTRLAGTIFKRAAEKALDRAKGGA